MPLIDATPLTSAPAPSLTEDHGRPALRYEPEAHPAFPGFLLVGLLVHEGEAVRWYIDAYAESKPDTCVQRSPRGEVARETWDAELARAGGSGGSPPEEDDDAAQTEAPQASIPALFKRWRTWLEVHAPGLASRLPPGAPVAELDAAEDLVGRPLPTELRAVYLTHDGDGTERFELGIIGNWRLLSLGAATRIWSERAQQLREGVYEGEGFEARAAGPVRSSWWSESWFPIADDSSSNHLCVDLDPAEGGQPGQIIVVYNRDPARAVLAPSVAAWMGAIVERLEDGRFGLCRVPSGAVEFYDSGFLEL